MAKSRPPSRGSSGRRPNYTRPGGGGGGTGGGTGGTRHKGGGTSSSSVHDGPKILVMTMATAVLGVIGGVGAFMAHGYGVF